MSSNRLIYDNDAHIEQISRITRPGDYRIFPGQSFNCNRCVATTGPRNNRIKDSSEVDQPSSWKRLVNIENVLSNRDTLNSKSMRYQSMENKKKRLFSNELDYRASNCNPFLQPEDTRLTRNKQDYRNVYWGRLGNHGYPIIDPREYVFSGHNTPKNNYIEYSNVRFGRNTRLEARDNYVTRYPVIIEDMISIDNGVTPIGEVKTCNDVSK